MAAIAEMYVRIGAQVDGLLAGLNDTDRRLRETSAGFDAAAGSAGGLRDIFLGGLGAEVVAGALTSAMAAVSDFVGSALDHLGEVEQINAQTAAAIRSTGGAAGVTAEQVGELANSIESATGVSGEMIQQGENLLLTFTNIKNRAGEGNDVFNKTTAIMADMSAALGTDAKGAALQLGKALNDPIQGVSALQRVGVSFTEGQKASIKAMQEHGNIAGAQKLILAELNKEFGGSAAAFGKTWPGILEKAGAAWENFGDALLGPLMPAFKAGMATMADTVNALANVIGEKGLAGALHEALGPRTEGLLIGIATAFTAAVVPSILATLPPLAAQAAMWVSTAAAALAAYAPVILMGASVAFIAGTIIKHWSEIPGAFSAYFSLAESTMLSWYQTARQVALNVGTAFGKVAEGIGKIFNQLFGGLGQEIQAAWNNLPDAVRGPLAGVANAFKGMAVEVGSFAAEIPGAIAGQVQKVTAAAYTMGGALGQEFQVGINQVKGYLGDLGAYINSFGADTVKAFTRIGDDAGEGHAAGHKKGGKKAVSEAEKAAKAIGKIFDDLGAKLASVGGKLAQAIAAGDLGEEIKAQTALVKTLEAALADLVKKKVSPSSSGFKELQAQLTGASERLADLKRTWDAFGRLEAPWKAQQAAFQDFQEAMQEARVQTLAVGEAFDVQGAKADALQKLTVGLIKAGFDPMGKILTAVREQMKGAAAASEDFATKLANKKFMVDFDEGTAQIQRRLTNLGPAFVGAGEQADLARRAWEQAGGMAGMSADQVEMLRAKADEASLAAGRGGLAFEAYTTATNNAGQAISNLRAGLAGIGEAIGLELNDPVTAAAANAVGLAMSLGQVAEAAPHVVDAVGKLSGDISTLMGSAQAGPFALAAAAAVAVGVALYKMGEDTSKVRARYDADIEAIAEETVKKADQMSDGWYRVGQDIMRIARGIRAAWDWMTGPTDEARRKMDELAQQMQQSRDQAKALTEAYNTLGESIRTGVEGATKSAIKAFMSGAGSMTSLLRDGIRNAIVDGMIEATLQKGLIQKQFGGLIDSIAIAATDGRNGEVERLIGQLGSQIPQVARQLESTFGTLKATLNKAFDPIQGIMDARGKAYEDAQWQANTLGSTDAAGLLKAKAAADEKALEALRDAGLGSSGAFQDILATLGKNRSALVAAEEAAKAAAKAAKDDGKDSAKALEAQQKAIREAYQGSFDVINAKLTQVANNSGTGSAEGQGLIAQLAKVRAEMDAAMRAAAASVPALASGGVTTGPALALIGEGRHREAVLPLSADTYRALAAGIASESRGAPASSGQVNIYITNTGKGRWTDQDAEELGAKIVTRLKREGVRV